MDNSQTKAKGNLASTLFKSITRALEPLGTLGQALVAGGNNSVYTEGANVLEKRVGGKLREQRQNL